MYNKTVNNKTAGIKENMKKVLKNVFLAILILFLLLCVITVIMLFVPRKRTFTYFYVHNNASSNDIKMFDDTPYAYQYSARSSGHYCYVDADEELPDLNDSESIDLNTHPIGIRLYRTDNSGIWMSFPVIVFKYDK